jgi:hypothetical protein
MMQIQRASRICERNMSVGLTRYAMCLLLCGELTRLLVKVALVLLVSGLRPVSVKSLQTALK